MCWKHCSKMSFEEFEGKCDSCWVCFSGVSFILVFFKGEKGKNGNKNGDFTLAKQHCVV